MESIAHSDPGGDEWASILFGTYTYFIHRKKSYIAFRVGEEHGYERWHIGGTYHPIEATTLEEAKAVTLAIARMEK